ncbi:MAG: helix-turn-helix domain-containing protein, partial [Actinomadura sp.]
MRFRLQPTVAQEAALMEHCAHARFVWNLAVEQHRHWRLGQGERPGSTDLARRFDVIRVEDLKIRHMVRSARGTVAEPGKNVRAKAGL